MKIYTRTGDAGSTGLFGGERVPKSHQRLVAYGTLDELNSVLGVLLLDLDPRLEAHGALRLVQRDLFALGAVLATPPAKAGQLEQRLTHAHLARGGDGGGHRPAHRPHRAHDPLRAPGRLSGGRVRAPGPAPCAGGPSGRWWRSPGPSRCRARCWST